MKPFFILIFELTKNIVRWWSSFLLLLFCSLKLIDVHSLSPSTHLAQNWLKMIEQNCTQHVENWIRMGCQLWHELMTMIKSELLLNITRYVDYFSPDIALFWDFFFWCTVFLDIFTLLIFSFLLLQDYKQCFEGAGTNPGEKTLEDKFFEYEVSFLYFKK